MKYCILGKRSSGETLCFNNQGEFSLRSASVRLYDNKKDPVEALKVLTENWKGLSLSVEKVADTHEVSLHMPLSHGEVGHDGY